MKRDALLRQFKIENVDTHGAGRRPGYWLVGDIRRNLHGLNPVGIRRRLAALQLVDILHAFAPGAPVLITATGRAGQAEMVTDEGAIYLTTDAARNWKAAVEATISATLNRTVSSGVQGASYYTGTLSTIARNNDGDYIGLSSRGNFYMTWSPGQAYWQPHNRSSGRRVQSMGWRPDGGIWELTRGGGIFFSNTDGLPENDDDFSEGKIGSRGFGLLDLTAKPNGKQFWIVGGSGSVFYSNDAGKSWKRDRGTDNVAGNLYNVKFSSDDSGFILGNDGILLRYVGPK